MHKPKWFTENKVLIVNAKTCGINKDGHEQYIVSPETGIRSNSKIDDSLADSVEAILQGDFSKNEIFFHSYQDMLKKDVFVPKFYDYSSLKNLDNLIQNNQDFKPMSLGELVQKEFINLFNGHGSPSSDQRLGTVPYIKVSDLRAGHVNINPTNMVPEALAKKFWSGDTSGLKAYDLISPERASKNIGEFCVLMPGQEKAVLTKEVIVIRATEKAPFDQFYLLFALSLKEVREQWDRIVFMQTNREDVGKRVYEITIPIPASKKIADNYSKVFCEYYQSLKTSRNKFVQSLSASNFEHYIYLGE